MESNIISEVLMEAAGGKKTVDAIMKAFQTNGYKISSQTAMDIQGVFKAAQNIPTEYFEAKPQRAVGFGEVLAAVVPSDSSERLQKALADAGVNILTYESGNDADRLAKVNSVEDARFSRSTREVLDAYAEQYGEIPAGEKPYRTIKLPKRTAEDKYVSQTIRTVLEAKATPKAMVPTLEDMVADGKFSYDRYTDKQAVSDAESKIKAQGWQKILNQWKKKTKKEVSKEAMATGWALYNNAANNGDVETALEVLEDMVAKPRNAAQALQAVRILKQQEPSTQLYGVQRSVENLQEELNERYGKGAPELKVNRELAEKFLNAKTDKSRTEAMAELYRDIGRQMPRTQPKKGGGTMPPPFFEAGQSTPP